jgi:hypothetical protein
MGVIAVLLPAVGHLVLGGIIGRVSGMVVVKKNRMVILSVLVLVPQQVVKNRQSRAGLVDLGAA